jgi:hypothetical protein
VRTAAGSGARYDNPGEGLRLESSPVGDGALRLAFHAPAPGCGECHEREHDLRRELGAAFGLTPCTAGT